MPCDTKYVYMYKLNTGRDCGYIRPIRFLLHHSLLDKVYNDETSENSSCSEKKIVKISLVVIMSYRNNFQQRNGTQYRNNLHRNPGEYGNLPSRSTFCPVATLPPPTAPAFDFGKLQGFMDTMSRSMEALASRLNSLEKGPPSRSWSAVVTTPTPALGANPQLRDSFFPPKPNSYRKTGPPLSRPAPNLTRSGPLPAPQPPAPTAPTVQSTNPDFHQICKALNRSVQIRRHSKNWLTLPSAISRNIQHVAQNIRPVHPSDETTKGISDIFSRAGTEVQELVLAHLSQRLQLNLTILKQSNPLDKDRAVEVVLKQLRNRVGNKVPDQDLRPLIVSEAKVIGTTYGIPIPPNPVDPEQDGFRVPGNAAKKPCRRDSTSSHVPTHNRFSGLEVAEPEREEEEEDVEEEEEDDIALPHTPSPPRKTRPKPSNTPTHTPQHTPAPIPKPRSSPLPPPPVTSLISPLPSPPPPPPTVTTTTASNTSIGQLNKHGPQDKPSWAVHLHPNTKNLIIADSNFRSLVSSDIPPDFQLESFSGANFANTLDLIKGLPTGQIQRLVIAMGINHKGDDYASRTLPALNSFLECCSDKSLEPLSLVGVSINPNFSPSWTENLSRLNTKLRLTCPASFISPLAHHDIFTTADQVHYTRDTQLRVLQNIIQHTKN